MKRLKFDSDIPSLIWWSLSTGWNANRGLFITLNSYRVFNGTVVTLVNTYLAAKATAAVAGLAGGTVSVKTPILYALSIAVINIIFLFISSVTNYYGQKFDSQTELVLAGQFHRAVNQLNQEQIDDEAVQDKITIADRNFFQLKRLSESLIELISSAVTYVTSIIVLAHYSTLIALLLLVITPILVWTNIIKSRREQQNWEQSSSLWREQYQTRDMLLQPSSFFQMTILGARERLLDYWEHVRNLALHKDLAVQRKNELLEVAESTGREGLNLASKVWAIMLVSKSRLGFDQFLFAMGLIEQAINATWTVSRYVRNIHEGVAAGRAGKDVINLRPIRADGNKELSDDGDGVAIDLHDVSFGYPSSDSLYENLNLNVKKGEKIAIVGENGAGKTTLVRLMLGQYAPTAGNVAIDAINIFDYSRASLYANTSVLLQEYALIYFLTIRQNFEMATTKPISDEAIYEALEMVGMASYVRSLKHGLDSRLHPSFEHGVNLSGGQAQRLAVARSFARNAKLLIMDEPTSAIDSRAEKMIFDNIFSRHDKATTVIISHRFSTVRKADRIIVIDKGAIVEDGSHNELMKLNGVYADMFNKQAEGYR